MHHKKSEVQIGKESIGVSSDFNPSPPFPISPLIHQKYHPFHQLPLSHPHPTSQSVSRHDSVSQSALLSAPHKRPLVTHNPSLSKSPTFSSLHKYSSPPPSLSKRAQVYSFLLSNAVVFRVLGKVRRFRVHLRLVLLLSLPFFYFLVSNPSRSLILDILSAFAFSATLLLSLHLALPRLPSIRVFLARSFPIKLFTSSKASKSNTPLPVFWSIGSGSKQKKTTNSGCWVRIYSNGDVYEGEFHKGECSGSGVYYYYMSGRYEGDWVNGKYDGYGVETWARGSRYRGQYLRGLRHGFGVYRFYTGDVYVGEWCNGQSHGSGVHTCEDGSRYMGEFKWGAKHGLGHYHFRNGDIYAGEYFADKMQGFGVYRFGNGHRFEGGWHEGKRQGLGIYSFRSGESQCGLWHNGILDIPSTQTTTTSTSSVAVSHSRVLNAVQEARGAAEKAYSVRKVDERVNRAVNSANRAANAGRVAAVKAVQHRHTHLPMSM